MKTVPAALTTALRTAYNVVAKPRLTVEWNYNRYATTTVDNFANESDYGYDTELFSIESIVSPNRPTKGIVKARADEAVVTSDNPLQQNVRFYTIHPEDSYKYWTSPVQTNGSGVFPTFSTAWASSMGVDSEPAADNQTVVRPYVNYSAPVKANKITIKTENTWATASEYEVLYKTTVGGSWITTSITSGLNNATGELNIYWDGTGWVTTKPTGAVLTTSVAGVMFKVNRLGAGRDLDGNITTYQTYSNSSVDTPTTGFNSYFSLIEIAACLEADLSSKIIRVSDDFDISEASIIYPIGTITGQSGEVTLSNLYTDAEFGGSSTTTKVGLFNSENAASPFAGLAEQNAVFNLSYVYTVGTTEYVVQQFKMYAGPWRGEDESTVSVPLRDYTKFFDEESPTECFWTNMTVSEIVWRLCDKLGFVNYEVSVASTDSVPNISYFWTDGKKTMLEILDELSQATQTAIYFDSWGVLQIRSREHAFNKAASPVWTFRGVQSGNELTDIVSMETSGEAQTNHVTVTYYSTDITEWNKGIPKMERIWEPEGTVALMGTPLLADLGTGTGWIQLSEKASLTWPYKGMMNIEGEFIRYDGKEYVYFDASNVRQTVTVKSLDEKKKFDAITKPVNKWKNTFTGRLNITERGVWNTEPKTHTVNVSGYSVRKMIGGSRNTDANGFRQEPARSLVNLTSTFDKPANMLVATRGNDNDPTYYYYGTRMRFVKGSHKDQRAGLVFNNNGTNEDGYFVELQSNERMDDADRKQLIFYTRTSGNDKRKGGKGRGVFVPTGKWMDIDVAFQVLGNGDHQIDIAINGKTVMTQTLSSDKNPVGGKFGMFTRGDTQAEFEYLYATKGNPGEAIDDTNFWDVVEGGWMGSQWDSKWLYKWIKKKNSNKVKRGRKVRFFDDFGPWCQEIREYEARFDPFPVTHSNITVSNPDVLLPQYEAGAFGASFIIANKARRNVIVNGNDSGGEFGNKDGRNSVMMIHGRLVEVKEAETVERTNDAQIKIKGKIESTMDSPWIQSEDAAIALGDWINNHWSTGADEINITFFGNPLFEIGDVVAVDFPLRFMTASTHKYFVMGLHSDFQSGLLTSATLRRVT